MFQNYILLIIFRYMGFDFGKLWDKIPQKQFDIAVSTGLMIAGSISIFYLFFGRLFSINELIGSILKSPKTAYSKQSLIVLSGIIFISALIKTFYHEHLTDFYPYDELSYLKKISTFRLIISGIIMGFGYQYATGGFYNDGLFGVPRFTLRSLISTSALYISAILTASYKLFKWVPNTPRILELADENLPRNITFDSYLLVTILMPFLIFLISPKKSLKGLIQCLVLFLIGTVFGYAYLVIGLSNIENVYVFLIYSKIWGPNVILIIIISMFAFAFTYLIVKYGFKKPLFSNNLIDEKGTVTLKLLIGSILLGVGWGLSGICFEGFLLTIPSSSLRFIIFWGLPCIFTMKAAQVLTFPEQTQKQQKIQ